MRFVLDTLQMRGLRSTLLVALLIAITHTPAFAGRTWQLNAGALVSTAVDGSVTCDMVAAKMKTNGDFFAGGTCDKSDDAIAAGMKGNSFTFNYILKNGSPYQVTIRGFGNCEAGRFAGEFKAFAGYTNAAGDTVQDHPSPGSFAYKGCMVARDEPLRCYSLPGEAQPAPGIEATYCNWSYKETGEEAGGSQSGPSQDIPPYKPPGGGTDPGGGGTDPGGGGTDPGGGGTNPGGGGTDPGGGGTNPGGGGTDPGGGTSPGGGNSGNSDFCAKNPGLNVCKNSSWSGSCGDIVCNGDAIQCEILRIEAANRCEKKDQDDVLARMKERALGEKILAGDDPEKDNLPSRGNAEQIGLPSFENSGWLGGGQCFSDKVVSVMGSSITIPFSQTCQYLVILRYALMVVALLISFKVLSGAIIRD